MSEAITLHGGVPVDLNTDTGHAFIADATRAAEGLISDRELAEKYELSPADWQAIVKDAAIGRAIRVERERRVLSGVAVREAAARHLVKGPGILDQIMTGDSSAKTKIEAFKELRTTATVGGSTDRTADTEKFIIHIDLGDHTIHHEFDQPIKIDASVEDSPNNLIPLKGKYDDDDRW
jgi:hypothetical protein